MVQIDIDPETPTKAAAYTKAHGINVLNGQCIDIDIAALGMDLGPIPYICVHGVTQYTHIHPTTIRPPPLRARRPLKMS